MDWAASTTRHPPHVRERLHHDGHEGSRGDHQGRDSAPDTNGRAHQEAGVRHDGHQQNGKGKGAADIDDPAQHAVEALVRPDALGLGDNEGDTQRNADDVGQHRREDDHDQGFPGALNQDVSIVSPESRNGFKHGTRPPQR